MNAQHSGMDVLTRVGSTLLHFDVKPDREHLPPQGFPACGCCPGWLHYPVSHLLHQRPLSSCRALLRCLCPSRSMWGFPFFRVDGRPTWSLCGTSRFTECFSCSASPMSLRYPKGTMTAHFPHSPAISRSGQRAMKRIKTSPSGWSYILPERENRTIKILMCRMAFPAGVEPSLCRWRDGLPDR